MWRGHGLVCGGLVDQVDATLTSSSSCWPKLARTLEGRPPRDLGEMGLWGRADIDNIDADALSTLRQIADDWLGASVERIPLGLAEQELQEVRDDDEKT